MGEECKGGGIQPMSQERVNGGDRARKDRKFYTDPNSILEAVNKGSLVGSAKTTVAKGG